MTASPRRTLALAAALVVVLPAGAALAAPPDRVLPRSQHGEAAVRALGERLPAVASAHGRSAALLREQLRTDPTLWVDPSLRLFYVEPPATAPVAAPAAAAALAPLADTFVLHSRPGAQRTVYLDFDGHAAAGAGWNDGVAFTSPAYSIDADSTSFDDAERTQVQLAWQRIAEDYAPFAVDVTTQEPAPDRLARTDTSDQEYGTRLVVTPTDQQGCGCGGIAYVGVFDLVGAAHDHYQPAFVYTSGVGTSGKNIAEAGSHEVGHNLGLSHDGTAGTGYYEGQGAWAPIMGVGYYRPVSQWSKGEYSGANQREDDFLVMASHGATLRADDQVGAAALLAATVTADGGASWTASGVIGTATDVDVFALDVPAGRLSLTVDVAEAGADLDARLQLVGPTGSVVATADPAVAMIDAGSATGLSASLSASVPAAGRYTVRVDGVGFGSASTTGYSDYGSVGAFRLTGTLVKPPGAPAGLVATPGGSTVALVWGDVAGETGYELVREKQGLLGTVSTTNLPSKGADTTSATDVPGKGTFRYRVRAVGSGGASAWTTSATVTVTHSKGK